MSPISYRTGDPTDPATPTAVIIAHPRAATERWGGRFEAAISRRWPQPEAAYRAHRPHGRALGSVDLIEVTAHVAVATMIIAPQVRFRPGHAPIDYRALSTALRALARCAQTRDAGIRLPVLGTALKTGNWQVIEPQVRHLLCDQGIAVTVYLHDDRADSSTRDLLRPLRRR